MSTTSTVATQRNIYIASTAVAASALALLAFGSWQAAPSAEAQEPVRPVPATRDGHHHAAAPVTQQPAAKLVVSPPKPEPLARGVALVEFRTENLQVVPVFGPAAAAVAPRIGHLHVTVDDSAWHWAHTSDGPVIVAPLAPGPHKILFELADANHKVLTQEVVQFDVPRR
jgi:Family of unknown function (DUF6130)